VGRRACVGATFVGVLFGDRFPQLIAITVQASRNLGRERAPEPGAFYRNCDAALAAGVAPIYYGEPGYRAEMDGDGDGIACEPYRGF
jgi:hypothetical protein